MTSMAQRLQIMIVATRLSQQPGSWVERQGKTNMFRFFPAWTASASAAASVRAGGAGMVPA